MGTSIGTAGTASALVVGTGPTGLATALALARCGVETLLAGPVPAAPRARTAALFSGSIELLRNLGVFAACADGSAAIKGIRLIDDTGGLLRAPEALFTAADSGLDVLGYNIPNSVLLAALRSAVDREPRIRMVTTRAVTALEPGADMVTAHLAEGGTLTASLAVAADGRQSLCRTAAGIGTRSWTYPQTAVVALFEHTRPHRNISTELHRRPGPLTAVPMPGMSSSLVWVEEPGRAEALMALDEAAFRAELERHLKGLLGRIGPVKARAAFPLGVVTADRFAARRVALVGEAAHVIPPIGAQGLNLGMRDVAMLADAIGDAVAAGRDPGSDDVLASYDAARRSDIGTRTLAVDLLNRTLISGLLPADLLRGFGLHALNRIAPLRHAMVRQGLQPSGPLPRLMRPHGA